MLHLSGHPWSKSKKKYVCITFSQWRRNIPLVCFRGRCSNPILCWMSGALQERTTPVNRTSVQLQHCMHQYPPMPTYYSTAALYAALYAPMPANAHLLFNRSTVYRTLCTNAHCMHQCPPMPTNPHHDLDGSRIGAWWGRIWANGALISSGRCRWNKQLPWPP